MDRAAFVASAATKDIVNVDGKEYVKNGVTVSVKCKKPYVGRTEPERKGDKIEYKCLVSER